MAINSMGAESHYWTLVRLHPAGGYRTVAVSTAREFFVSLFSKHLNKSDISDQEIQKKLVEVKEQGDKDVRRFAEGCLRCYISHEILKTCLVLNRKFQNKNDFLEELLSLVLDDDGYDLLYDNKQSFSTTYKKMSTLVLESFDPDEGTLSSWTNLKVRHSNQVNKLLLDQGIYLVSDWALLNDTTTEQLRRILGVFIGLSDLEVEDCQVILNAYHAIYRKCRIQQKKRGKTTAPSEFQLQEIAKIIEEKYSTSFSSSLILKKLREMASCIRNYRISVRTGAPLKTVDTLEMLDSARLEIAYIAVDEAEQEQFGFLETYREFLTDSLDQSIETVLQKRLEKLRKRGNLLDENKFMIAMYLFHRDMTMSQIADKLGLKAQYQVTRLLKLKEFRDDVRYEMLSKLRQFIQKKVNRYHQSEISVEGINYRIEEALEESIGSIFEEARANAMSPQSQEHLFRRQVCHVLETINPDIVQYVRTTIQ